MNETDIVDIEPVTFDVLEIPPRLVDRLKIKIQSWNNLHPVLRSMKDSNRSLTALAYLIALEMQNPDGPRDHILRRLHMRLNAMRQRMEIKQIEAVATR